ncbi:16S rRNA (cytosine(967)-C(5))-methyltransferase RsmB [Denitromonas iodatirespirans]|uniref:16S rRNA (cytosine(967)-C(5))-methyltransferase n=1 Tax=Denitromonas iodatirespirans TaxID=2795389 RepID=A0A944DJG8_DENI1|nr:16S rRNA (cytosine(967)-C(5))-methyltransferase RsmB [Denitromonas iodatirespirans]MBT0959959.1 16S rRNA (cytosine(967)-C(5))-methyltransferase RsmB [Denitromonas iodatirespirans]
MTDHPRRRARVQPTPRLPADSLAYTIDRAAALVEAVVGGKALTEMIHLERITELPAPVRGAVLDLTYGSLRDYARGDRVLAHCLSKPLPLHLHAILLVALHRLEARPDTAHTIVDQAVTAVGAHAPGLKAVANGVLRKVGRERAMFEQMLEKDAQSHHRHPNWWIRLLETAQPEHWQAVLAAGNQHPPMALRANLRQLSLADASAQLTEAGLSHRILDNGALLLDTPVPVDRIPGFAEGRFSVQDAGAQWAAQWLAPRTGERVLDACAAPGGKSAHLLESADIALTALELDPTRARRIGDTLARLGLSADVRIGDARHPEHWWDGQPFDRILADVPCSASGVARRHPDIKWLRRATDIAGFAAQQSAILDALWHTLAPGGTMLYVTCSVFDAENRDQIAHFCARHADARRIAIQGRMEHQLLPDAEHDGFYYALLEKTR